MGRFFCDRPDDVVYYWGRSRSVPGAGGSHRAYELLRGEKGRRAATQPDVGVRVRFKHGLVEIDLRASEAGCEPPPDLDAAAVARWPGDLDAMVRCQSEPGLTTTLSMETLKRVLAAFDAADDECIGASELRDILLRSVVKQRPESDREIEYLRLAESVLSSLFAEGFGGVYMKRLRRQDYSEDRLSIEALAQAWVAKRGLASLVESARARGESSGRADIFDVIARDEVDAFRARAASDAGLLQEIVRSEELQGQRALFFSGARPSGKVLSTAGFLGFGDAALTLAVEDDALGLDIRLHDRLDDIAERNCKWRIFDRDLTVERGGQGEVHEAHARFERQGAQSKARQQRLQGAATQAKLEKARSTLSSRWEGAEKARRSSKIELDQVRQTAEANRVCLDEEAAAAAEKAERLEEEAAAAEAATEAARVDVAAASKRRGSFMNKLSPRSRVSSAKSMADAEAVLEEAEERAAYVRMAQQEAEEDAAGKAALSWKAVANVRRAVDAFKALSPG